MILNSLVNSTDINDIGNLIIFGVGENRDDIKTLDLTAFCRNGETYLETLLQLQTQLTASTAAASEEKKTIVVSMVDVIDDLLPSLFHLPIFPTKRTSCAIRTPVAVWAPIDSLYRLTLFISPDLSQSLTC